MHFLVNHVQARIQNELVSRLYKRELLDDLLSEDPAVAQQRARASEMLAALNRAALIVAEVYQALLLMFAAVVALLIIRLSVVDVRCMDRETSGCLPLHALFISHFSLSLAVGKQVSEISMP